MKRTQAPAVMVTGLTTGKVGTIALLTIVKVAIVRIVRDLILIVKEANVVRMVIVLSVLLTIVL